MRGRALIGSAILLAIGCGMKPDRDGDSFATAREIMLNHDLRARGIADTNVLAAMARVPRHQFVPSNLWNQAYADYPLPIGEGQTISQPYIVAAMTALIRPKTNDVVLEVGTGSGYQAAVLSELVRQVYTIEIVEPLGRSAASRLRMLGYSNVTVRVGDGYAGWAEHAPFDSIIVTCGAEHVPPPLVEQLKPGGRMVIPVGPVGGVQSLLIVEKDGAGLVSQSEIMAVRFVPLTRPAGNGGHE